MKKTKILPNPHPGEILLEDFLKPMGVSQYKLAKDAGIPHSRVTRIIQGVQGITPDTDARLSLYFGTSRGYWLGLQTDYDIMEYDRHEADRVKSEVKPLAIAG